MAKRVDVSANVRTERDGIGRRADTAVAHQVPVLLGEAVKERRMRGVMRHAGKPGLGKVVDAGAGEEVEKLGKVAHHTSRTHLGLIERYLRLLRTARCRSKCRITLVGSSGHGSQ